MSIFFVFFYQFLIMNLILKMTRTMKNADKVTFCAFLRQIYCYVCIVIVSILKLSQNCILPLEFLFLTCPLGKMLLLSEFLIASNSTLSMPLILGCLCNTK